MYLSLFLLLGVSVNALFAGTIPKEELEEKQHLLLNVIQPIYHLDDDACLNACSEAQRELEVNSDVVASEALKKLKLGLKYTFYLGTQSYRQNVKEIAALLKPEDFDSFVRRANILRSCINPPTYNIALKTALSYREDVTDLWYPPLWQINSRSFFTEEMIFHATKQSREKISNMEFPTFNPSAFVDPEYRTAWFREDISLNEMHAKVAALHVHDGHTGKGPVEVFHLFTQILARYDAERLAVELPRVEGLHKSWLSYMKHNPLKWYQKKPEELFYKNPYQKISYTLTTEKDTIAEGYDPHLSINLGEKRFAARPANMKIQDDLRDPDNIQTAEQFTYLAQKIEDNIRTGFMNDENGEQHPMTKELLDDMIRGLSTNKRLYTEQGIHRLGHQLLSVIADPDGRYQQEIGVMGTPEAALRDPVFYRYHRLIYNFYDMYQMTLPAYGESDFQFSGIRVEDVDVKCIANPQEGVLETFMESSEAHIMYDPTIGDHLAKDSKPHLKIPYERLNHHKFEYVINVHNNNPSGDDVKAVVRIFIAPHNDETKMRFKSLNDQRRFFIELDKFVIPLRNGHNVIKRSSVMSSVSFPSVDTYEEWRAFVNTYGRRQDRVMGCGWPSNLLLPRGTPEGMDFDLFVMLTDWEKERAESVEANVLPDLDFGSSLCGVKGTVYPFNKSRGFPFDRKFTQYEVLRDFAKDFENMSLGNLKIVHKK